MTWARATRFGALLGVALFWAGVFGAGALAGGYSPRADYISSLAGRGSPVAALAICALLASAAANLATALAVLTAWRSRVVALLVLAAGIATTVVALFRTSCPEGPAGCGRTDAAGDDWVDVVHGMGVGFYELFTLGAMLTLAAGALRRSPAWPRWLGVVSLAAAAGSVLLFGQTNGDDLGLWQRLWLADNLAWLLVVAWAATTVQGQPPGSAEPHPAK